MKYVLVTGINKGLGNELFTQFANEGYFVFGLVRDIQFINDYNQSPIPNTELIHADISKDECMDKIKSIVGNRTIDLAINNAGIGGQYHLLEKVTSEEILHLFDVHCLGALRVIKAVQGNLMQSQNPVCININSRLGSITHQNQGTFKHLQVSYSYRIAKAAQNMLTNCLRVEFGEQIKFISLNPGKLITGISQVDADITPKESVKNIITYYKAKEYKHQNGIFEIPNTLLEW